jgi:hypothetical protein
MAGEIKNTYRSLERKILESGHIKNVYGNRRITIDWA